MNVNVIIYMIIKLKSYQKPCFFQSDIQCHRNFWRGDFSKLSLILLIAVESFFWKI